MTNSSKQFTMLNRRSFLKVNGTLLVASMVPASLYANLASNSLKTKYPPIGLQAYTLRFLLNDKASETQNVLKQIAGLGIKELETATGTVNGLYYGHKPKAFADMVKDAGMVWVGNHVKGLQRSKKVETGPDARVNLKDNLQQIVDEAAEGGCSWIVCASSAISSLDEIKQTTELFVKTGETAGKSKMKFAYHNHQSEFTKIDGTSAYEYVLGQTTKEEVCMELDLAWATQAGMDPVEMFQQFPGRFPLWHVKDIDPATDRPCTLGSGKVDFKRIYENSKLSGVKHTFIEQDSAKSISEVTESVKWLQSNLKQW
jgi:sugar phosphate isomerase/epimerase